MCFQNFHTMNWHKICHAKNFSPNLGRPLKSDIPIDFYKKIYSYFKDYDSFEKNSLNVYTLFLHEIIKEFKEYNILNSILEDVKGAITYPQTYGVKVDEGGVLRLELYFYYNKRKNFNSQDILKEYCLFLDILKKHKANVEGLEQIMEGVPLDTNTIWSYDFFNSENLFGTQINFYTKDKILNQDIVYWGNQFTKGTKGKSKEGTFLCFHKNYKLNLKEDLNYNFTQTQLLAAEKIIKKYKCKECNISNKTETNGEIIFFIQYFGISDEDFLLFLRDNNYPLKIIEHYKNNINFYSTMSKEITEVFRITTKEFKQYRSGFYGLL